MNRYFSQKSMLVFILLASLVLRLPALVAPHIEGDEVIYQTLARKTAKNFFDYSTQNTGIVEWTASPLYDTKLFLHPPLFVWALALTHGAGLEDWAVMIPVLAGLLAILLVFLIAKEIGLGKHALTSAGLLALDPILFFTSSKILIEAPLAALVSLSVYLLLLAARRGRAWLFLAAGLAGGAALLTKYMAIAAGPALLYVFLVNRKRIKNPWLSFSIFALAGAVVIVPWLAYYGANSGWQDLFGRALPAEYLNRFPFVQMVVERPWHTFFSHSLILAPVYFIAWLGLAKIIRSNRNFLPAAWAFSFFIAYTLVVAYTGMAGYNLRYLAPAAPAMAILAACAAANSRILSRLAWPLALIGFAGGLLSVYYRPAIGDAFPVFNFILS